MTKKKDFLAKLEGLNEARLHQQKQKLTLKNTVFKENKLSMSPAQMRRLRRVLNVSQPVFAAMIRTKVQTYMKWEQGGVTPNAQGVTLMKLVQNNPDIIKTIADLN